MTATILGLGTACPAGSISQEDSVAFAGSVVPRSPDESRLIAALYRRTQVRRRGSVLLQSGESGVPAIPAFFEPSARQGDLGPSTGARGDRFNLEAPPLALRASRAALAEAGIGPASITHLITVSCTGFGAPGVDAALITQLHLAPTVQRTHVGFMGCHGAINGLRVAAAFANADPRACILVCAVELCSLHFHYAPDPQQIVANALFADGAAAAIVGTVDQSARRIGVLAGFGSCLLPDSAAAMTWRIGDHGFEMTLSPGVPGVLQSHLRGWIEPWLESHGIAMAHVGSWAVHPGGPRILGTVAECLDLPQGALDASRSILAEHGNMSSPTVLFILNALRKRRAAPPTVVLGFGPGLVAEAALVL